MTTENELQENQTTTKTQKKTTGPKTTRKKASSTSQTSSKREILESEGTKLINEGIELSEKIHARLGGQIERISKAVEDIRSECAKQGTIIPALNDAIRKSNSLEIYNVKLGKYLNEIKDESKPLEQKIAILSVMTKLNKSIETLDEL